MKSTKKWTLGLDGLVLLFALAAPHIADWMIGNLPPCLFLKMGVQCPSCGGTRCVRLFFTGKFAEALTINPFFFFLLLYAGVLLLLLNLSLFTQRVMPLVRCMSHYKTVIILACLYALFGIVRLFIPI